jgi:hypothetical protein
MATVKHDIGPRDGIPAATNGAQHNVFDGTNFSIPVLAFDAATSESVYFFVRAMSYGSGNWTGKIYWYADTASSGTVIWTLALAAITPDTDTGDVETKAFATANTVTDTHLGTTGQRLHQCSVTVSNLDSVAADDWVVLKLARDIADTMTGDALFAGMIVSYSDT